MSKLFSFRYNSSFLRFDLTLWQFQNNVCTHENKHQIPVMRDGLQGRSYLEDLGCLGTTLLVVLGGLRLGFGMADGLVSLVDAVNLNEDSSLLIDVLGLEVGGADGRSCPMASNRLIPVMLTPK